MRWQPCRVFRPVAAWALLLSLSTAGLIADMADAATWTVVPAQSRIAFGGVHAGKAFSGVFETWQAVIDFDPANPAAGSVLVTVDLASAKTGDKLYDGTLPGPDWLNVGGAPKAQFSAKQFKPLGGTRYETTGMVTLRSVVVPVVLTFDLVVEGQTARATGTARLKRLDFGIGKESDDAGAWVSLEIPVTISVVAKRQ